MPVEGNQTSGNIFSRVASVTNPFELHITSMADFLTFVTIIRGEELDIELLKAATTRLKTTNDALATAESAANK